MLFTKLVRPTVSLAYKIPSRSTSAVCGARSRHVSTLVSIDFIFFSFVAIPFNYSALDKFIILIDLVLL